MATNHYLEALGVQIGRGQEPSIAEMLYAIACTLDERVKQTTDVLIRIQMTGEELLAEAKHIRAALAPKPAYSSVGDDLDEEPDVDDEPPPGYGPPGGGAVITEYD